MITRRHHKRAVQYGYPGGRPASWETHPEWTLAGKPVRRGSLFRVRGKPKQLFRFFEYVRNHENGAEWVSATSGGKACDQYWTAFRPEDVTSVT